MQGFWAPRVAQALVFTILIIITYHGIGDNLKIENMTNIAAVLFVVVILPMFGAGIYTPTLVMGLAFFLSLMLVICVV